MRHPILISLFVLFISCSNASKELMSNFETDFPKSEELTQVARYDGFELGHPRSFVVKDSLLFVLDRRVEHFGKCFNINTGEEISKFVLKGKANTEMLDAEEVSLYGNDSLNVLSRNHPHMIKTYSTDIISNKNSTVSSLYLPDGISSFSFIKISDNEIFGTGCGSHASFKYFIATPNEITTFGEYDKNLFECNVELDDEDMHWNSQSTAHPSKNKIAVACRDGLMFEVVNLDDKKISHKYYKKMQIEIERVEGGKVTVYNNKIGCTTIGSTESNIIAVKRERTDNNEEDYTKWRFSSELLIFDWNLNPIKKYTIPIEKQVSHISQDGKYLYLLTTDDEESYSLLKYKI